MTDDGWRITRTQPDAFAIPHPASTLHSHPSSEFMHHALTLARAQLGQSWPNPSVGAVVVKDGVIIGKAATAKGGRPHAEPQALAQAGEAARGATLYVTLEPCSHHGQTPPCTRAIIEAGIKRVVVACRDPHPAHGGGSAQLRAAGIMVEEGLCEEEAREMNRGFFSVVEKNRPYVALKIASSADEKIAGGATRWITGEAAREEVHRLRSRYDAVLTGIGTVLADDPRLDVRLLGLEHRSPVRVVLDRNHRLPKDAKILRGASACWVLHTPTLPETLQELAQRGITRLLVEAGHGLNTAFLQSGLADRVYWFKAPHAIGAQGLSATNPALGVLLKGWKKTGESLNFGDDTLEIYDH
jgi:diaminohydroxyphosphoribosylaminopyrimidine deaminase/5-amino-6-(5-phosphoribosylamino)uracil reductase